MADTKKIAVAGLGVYPSTYHIPNLMAHPGAEIVGICDIAEERLTEIHEQTGARTFVYVGEMLDSLSLDALVVSSPHSYHYQHALAALNRGISVLVDKPFTLDVAEAQELVAIAKERNLTAMVALNRHLDSANLAARNAIHEDELGDLVYVRTLQAGLPNYGHFDNPALSGGGPIVARGIHMAALIPWMTGLRPKKLQATFLDGGKAVDIGALVNAEMDKGVMWQIACTPDVTHNIDEVQVYGTKGNLTVWRPNEGVSRWSIRRFGADSNEIELGEMHDSQTTTEHFVNVLRGEESPKFPIIDSIYSVAIIQGAYRSFNEGRPVEIAEDGSLS